MQYSCTAVCSNNNIIIVSSVHFHFSICDLLAMRKPTIVMFFWAGVVCIIHVICDITCERMQTTAGMIEINPQAHAHKSVDQLIRQ